MIPVPFVDALAVGGVQLKMLRELAAIFEVDFSENRGKSIIAALVGALGPASAAPVATSALKFIPGVGTAIASISMPALSAAATYAVGKVFVQHFLSGGTLLDFNPQDYRDYLREQAKTKTSKDAPATVSPAPAPTPSSTRGSAKTAN